MCSVCLRQRTAGVLRTHCRMFPVFSNEARTVSPLPATAYCSSAAHAPQDMPLLFDRNSNRVDVACVSVKQIWMCPSFLNELKPMYYSRRGLFKARIKKKKIDIICMLLMTLLFHNSKCLKFVINLILNL